jgi:hypothetical protein
MPKKTTAKKVRKKKSKKKVRKKNGPAKGEGGRPRKVLCIKTIEKLAEIGCTHAEIGWYCDVDERTINRRMKEPDFRRSYEKGAKMRKQSLRHMQWQTARAGNVAMQIFLGKNELGQSDRQGLDITVKPHEEWLKSLK